MRRPSIVTKSKKKVNGQILVDIKETQKVPTVSFSEALNNLKTKSLTKDINPKKKSKKKGKDKTSDSNNESKNSSSQNLPKSQTEIISLKNKRNSVSVSFNPKSRLSLFYQEEAKNGKDKKNSSNTSLTKQRRTSKNIEENDKKTKFMSRRHSVQVNLGKSFAEFSVKRRFSTGLSRTKEIVLGGKNEQIINPYKLSRQKEEEQKKNPKINIIEELRRFDREQKYKMEKYIDKKQKRYFDLMNKKMKIYHPIGNDNKSAEKKYSKYKNKNNNKEISKIEEDESNEYSKSSKSSRSSRSSRSSKSSYSKSSKTSKSNNDRSKNKTITEENENESENLDKNEENKADKEKNNDTKDKNNNNNERNTNDIDTNKENEDIKKDEFQKMKQKYLSKNIFTLNFPTTEYKIKYLDNFFQNDSLSKNLFGNYTNKKDENNKTNRSNLYNSIFKSPLNMKYSDTIRYDNYDLKTRSYNNITPKKLFKNPNDNDFSYNINDYNSKFNSNNLSLNSNSYTTLSNKDLSNHKTYDEIDKAYKTILNSIDDTLNDINRRRHQGNQIRALSSSIDKKKPFSSSNHKIHKNSFRYLSFKSKNKYYKDICDKFDKYNGFKMTRRYIIKDK